MSKKEKRDLLKQLLRGEEGCEDGEKEEVEEEEEEGDEEEEGEDEEEEEEEDSGEETSDEDQYSDLEDSDQEEKTAEETVPENEKDRRDAAVRFEPIIYWIIKLLLSVDNYRFRIWTPLSSGGGGGDEGNIGRWNSEKKYKLGGKKIIKKTVLRIRKYFFRFRFS